MECNPNTVRHGFWMTWAVLQQVGLVFWHHLQDISVGEPHPATTKQRFCGSVEICWNRIHCYIVASGTTKIRAFWSPHHKQLTRPLQRRRFPVHLGHSELRRGWTWPSGQPLGNRSFPRTLTRPGQERKGLPRPDREENWVEIFA